MKSTVTPIEEVLRIEGLQVAYGASSSETKSYAVQDLSLTISAGETVALVGESGCGKSTTGMAILRLLPESAQVQARVLEFEGKSLLKLSPAALQQVRGGGIGMVFQDALSALNPIMRVGDQIAEAVRYHHTCSKAQAQARARELLELVGIPEPDQKARAYPFQLSGGQRQRVVIAIALAGEPRLLIADEPTTALDVTVQAQILRLLRRLQQDLGMALLLITHDMGVVAEMADRVIVMRHGQCVEQRLALDLFEQPAHPYTRQLLASRIGQVQELAA